MIDESVKKNLIASEKVGCLLSGGLDSSIVAYLSQKHLDYPVNSYCLGDRSNKNINETDIATEFASELGLKHKNYYIQDFSIRDEFNNFVSCLDQPTCDGFNTFLITKAIQSETRVLLSGIGSDELFGGYDFYQLLLNNKMNLLKRKIYTFVNRIKLNRFTHKALYADKKPEEVISIFRNFKKDYNSFVDEQPLYCKLNKLAAAQKHEFNNYLLNTILRDVDNLSMCNSIEIRVPFIETNLVNYCYCLPDHLKIKGKIHKYILKETFRNKLSKKILSRKKMGFELSYERLMNDNLNDIFLDLLNTHRIFSFLNKYFNNVFMNNLYKRVFNKKTNRIDWNILILINWIYIHKIQID